MGRRAAIAELRIVARASRHRGSAGCLRLRCPRAEGLVGGPWWRCCRNGVLGRARGGAVVRRLRTPCCLECGLLCRLRQGCLRVLLGQFRRRCLGLLLGCELLLCLCLRLLLLQLLLMVIDKGLLLEVLMKLQLRGMDRLRRGLTIGCCAVRGCNPMSVASNSPAGTLSHLQVGLNSSETRW